MKKKKKRGRTKSYCFDYPFELTLEEAMEGAYINIPLFNNICSPIKWLVTRFPGTLTLIVIINSIYSRKRSV